MTRQQKEISMRTIKEVLADCTSYSEEQSWFEFKDNWYEPDGIGEYISALSNAAAMLGKDEGYLIWGVHDKTHELTNTQFNFHKDVKNEPLEHFLARNITPGIYFYFEEALIEGKRVVVLRIPAAHDVPTAYKRIRYLRIGSNKVNLSRYPQREAELFRILQKGLPNLLNTESRFSELTFDQLFLYYEMKGIKLNRKTFKENLELLTVDGKYNMLAQLLSDDPHIPIRFAVFKGKDKTSTMYAVREYGNMCILLSLDKVLDFGDILNIPQADERERVVERKEVFLFSKKAFREAVINAFVHNLWINGDSPMFTAYEDRIEIVSLGTLPAGQTKEGFFKGISIPVNKKLSEIFLQLHISEKSGRGVPRIVSEYGEKAFEFRDNAIVVTIPFNHLEVDKTPSDEAQTPSDTPQDGLKTPSDETQTPSDKNETPSDVGSKDIKEKILSFCTDPKGSKEILEHLGLRDIKNLRAQLKKLVEQGRLARTIPDKLHSKHQKYITIK